MNYENFVDICFCVLIVAWEFDICVFFSTRVMLFSFRVGEQILLAILICNTNMCGNERREAVVCWSAQNSFHLLFG